MTTYTVHLYREMRLVFPSIEAVTHEEAARIASGKETYDATTIEPCDGLDYNAVVDLDGDEDYDSSRPILLRADGGEIDHSPDPVTNRTRAAWAEAALGVFIQHTGCDLEDSLGDLLCDLMHWSEQHDFDFDLALDRARGHFEAELLEELPPPPDAEEHSAPVPFLLDVLDHVRATLKLRHLDQATDLEVEEALRMASGALVLAKGAGQ